MSIRFSTVNERDFAAVCALYREAVADMRARGLTQWEWGVYPSEELLLRDRNAATLYRADEDGALCAAFVLSSVTEDAYSRVSWHYGVKPAAMHRLAMRPDCFGPELAERILGFGKAEACRLGYDCLRVDVCTEDERMLRLFRSQMLREAGQVEFDHLAAVCACFEEPVSERCPMLPIRMRPAYRHGDATPWGSDGLRLLYGKNIPDERTGEALEISAIPGLESVTDSGESLTRLLRVNGARLTGTNAPFPLLLKLLAAKEPLSVQVHPGDDYARVHEGKLGKTEAWVILRAKPGASILYGVRDGVSKDDLRRALQSGGDVEAMIRRVPVAAGDVFYMPAGMVHAIGGGLVLYEIQQSSDVTYRLWDYRRLNERGEERPLHIRQSLDVIDTSLRGRRTRLPNACESGETRLLDTPAFQLDCLTFNGDLALASQPAFRLLTALAGVLLCWPGDALELEAGQSVLLPANCPPLTLTGVGQALLATPAPA